VPIARHFLRHDSASAHGESKNFLNFNICASFHPESEFGTPLAMRISPRKNFRGRIMKIEIPVLTGLLLAGTDLLTRVLVQGVELALFRDGN
jgi:hypothetical protein